MKKNICRLVMVFVLGVIVYWGNYSVEVEASELRNIKSFSLKFEDNISENKTEQPFILIHDKLPINDKDYYYIYIEDDTGYSLYKFDTDFIKIVKTDEVEPCIKGRFDKENHPFTTESQSSSHYRFVTFKDSTIEKYMTYTVYVPKNMKEVMVKVQ